MLEKIEHFVMDIAPLLPQKTIDCFNLTDADVLNLQYISLALPIIVFALNWYISIMIGGKLDRDFSFLKIAFMVIVIICYDNVIRQYFPLAIREALNNNMLMFEVLVPYVLLFIAWSSISCLLAFLRWTIKTINLVVFKKVKLIPLQIRKGTINQVPTAFLMLFSLSSLLQMIAITFYSVALYYNYCM